MKASHVPLVISMWTVIAPVNAQECTDPQLSNAQIMEVVRGEIVRRGGTLEPERWQFRIKEDKCTYVVVASAIPARPGDHCLMRIDRRRKILDFMPGA